MKAATGVEAGPLTLEVAPAWQVGDHPYTAHVVAVHAYAERWVGTARRECIDHLLILSRRHMDAVLAEFVEHYNGARPYRALGLDTPEAGSRPASPVGAYRIRRRDWLGGLIREYEVAA